MRVTVRIWDSAQFGVYSLCVCVCVCVCPVSRIFHDVFIVALGPNPPRHVWVAVIACPDVYGFWWTRIECTMAALI